MTDSLDAYLKYQAMYYYMNSRYEYANAIAQRDYLTRDGMKAPIEEIHRAMHLAKRCEELVAIAKKEYEEEQMNDNVCNYCGTVLDEDEELMQCDLCGCEICNHCVITECNIYCENNEHCQDCKCEKYG